MGLFVIAFLITIDISSAYFYFHWYLKKDNNYVNTGVNTSVNTSADTNIKIGTTIY